MAKRTTKKGITKTKTTTKACKKACPKACEHQSVCGRSCNIKTISMVVGALALVVIIALVVVS